MSPLEMFYIYITIGVLTAMFMVYRITNGFENEFGFRTISVCLTVLFWPLAITVALITYIKATSNDRLE